MTGMRVWLDWLAVVWVAAWVAEGGAMAGGVGGLRRNERLVRGLHDDHSLPLPHSMHELHPVLTSRHHRNMPGRQLLGAEITPLFPGYGTHFVYAYVGTPPQRQSLIVDTGSHYTAFPCMDCKQCGEHTDPYFDPKKSKTASVNKCLNNQECVVSQSYTEGSSWHGYKVTDKLWVGGEGASLVPGANSYAINFTFACQNSETGLFRTQLADGIMGMSNADDTLPNQLKRMGAVSNRVFALCFRVGGGILTLGGVNQKIHTKKSVSFVKMQTASTGLYQVFVRSVKLIDPQTGANYSVEAPTTAFNAGTHGTIVDSGTTDTYLPAAVASAFQKAFKKATGMEYSSGTLALTTAQLKKLPDIVFELEGVDKTSGAVSISMPMASYVDSVGDGKYAVRVYLTEKSGAVLGANFMNNYNVIFDTDAGRMGFAKSTCNYEEFGAVITSSPTVKPTSLDGGVPVDAPCDAKDYIPYTECTARCDRNESGYVAYGTQDYVSKCNPTSADIQNRPCQENCSAYSVIRGDPACPDKPWSDCAHGCVMSRMVVPPGEPVKVRSKCNYRLQTQTCYTGSCPQQDGDYLIYVDMRVRVEPWKWSYVHSETFYQALTKMFKMRSNSIELLNNAGNEETPTTKLHFQLRLKAKDYKSTVQLHDAAETIVTSFRSGDFGQALVSTLDETAQQLDHQKISRFGWLYAQDIEVLSAVAIPIGGIRDPDPNDDSILSSSGGFTSYTDYLLLGAAIGIILLLLFVLYVHFRLRQEYALMSKDKSALSKSADALKKLWQRFKSMAQTAATQPEQKLSREQLERELELSRTGLMEDVELDEDDDVNG